MYIGTTQYSKAYIGTSQVQKIYKGVTQVYSAYQWDSDALSLISRMSTQPSDALKVLINDTIINLKVAGIYSKLDCLYMFNVHDSQAACQNWAKNAHNITISGSPVFIPKVGFKGNGTNAALNLNYTLTDQGINFTRDNNSQGFVAFSPPASTSFLYGGRQSSFYVGASFYTDGNGTYLHACQTAANGANTYILPINSLVTFNRDDSNNERSFREGSNKMTFSKPSANMSTVQVRALAFWDYGTVSGYNTSGLSTLFFGASLTDSENAILNTIIKYFKDNVGTAIGGYDADTEYLLYRMSSQPTTALKNLIDITIRGLKSDGVFDLADCLYIRGVHDSQAACLNWIKGLSDSTLVNSPTFTPKIGITGNGSTSYINNNYTPSVYKFKLQLGNESFCTMHKALGTVNVTAMWGCHGSSGTVNMDQYFRTAGASEICYLGTWTDYNDKVEASAGDYFGFINTGTSFQGYNNGVSISTPTTVARPSLPNRSMYELALNVGSASTFYNGTTSFTFFGGGLDSTKMTSLYNRIKYFYDNVGGTF